MLYSKYLCYDSKSNDVGDTIARKTYTFSLSMMALGRVRPCLALGYVCCVYALAFCRSVGLVCNHWNSGFYSTRSGTMFFQDRVFLRACSSPKGACKTKHTYDNDI